jgi:post-segregation antitoxin (ccd killing protein)
MNKMRRTKVVNIGPRDAPVDAAQSLMSEVAPPDGDVSERGRRWQQENQAAIECYNEWISEYGLPLEEFRRF